MVCYKIGQFQCQIVDDGKGEFLVQLTWNNWESGRWITLNKSDCNELRQALREKDMVRIEEIIE